ncbi:MAG: hypothetical protein FJ276_04300 [Planctomycetes bacterium]|nr:hypothetical protein [Planctomycetota bacterium]
MAKAEVNWRRETAEGTRLQVCAQRVGGVWRFFSRERRFDRWEALEEPPLEDWLELLDAVQRLAMRGRLQPDEEERVGRCIRERFPDAEL